MKYSATGWGEVFLVVLFSLLLRLLVGSFPHSGQDTPPMFGDYEAQRHWMEITVHLPIKEWYEHTEDNDLLYWGLDYPPLSAYFSFCIGKILQIIDPQSVELFLSRGHVSLWSKLLMRTSVVISDLLFVTAAWSFIKLRYKNTKKDKQISLLLLLLTQPSLMIIDHGHFQYNNCSLGLILWAIRFVLSENFQFASILFTLATQYKIISLYFAPAFCLFFLGKVFSTHTKWRAASEVVKVIFVVFTTLALCWLPFLLHGRETALQVLKRCFPVDRGLYEDKVANFWCTISPVFKLRQWPNSASFRACLIVTATSLVPASFCLLFNKKNADNIANSSQFLLGLLSVSLSYFLFSFHVHEKTILFPLLPASLLALEFPILSLLMNSVGMWSMFPLLNREGLSIPFTILCLLHLIFSFSLQELKESSDRKYLMLLASHIGFFFLVVIQQLVPPSPSHPDLHTLLITSYCCAHFLLCFVYVNKILFQSRSSLQSKNKIQ